MEKNFIIAGFGGQGVLLAGTILANSFMLAGKNVTWYPCYGAEMRGGAVNCEVNVSSEELLCLQNDKVDVVVALNQLSLDKFISKVKENGTIIVNSSMAKINKTLIIFFILHPPFVRRPAFRFCFEAYCKK